MRITKICVYILPVILITSSFGAILAKEIPDRYRGFDKGVSWKPVLPLKKVTFVNFDKDSYLDDYAYLAAIPTTVFYDKSGDRLVSHPLLFYQDPYPVKNDKERTLDARKGIDYFMEDWLSYCNGRLDQMVLINVDKEKVKQWPAKDIVEIKGNDPYEIAAKIALHDWSYSDSAVIAVIKNGFERKITTISGEINGTLSGRIKYYHFDIQQTNSLNPVFQEFKVPHGYKYMKAEAWWDCLILMGFISVPTGDPDVQLYYRDGKGWIECSAANNWNILTSPGREIAYSHIYKSGLWRVGMTDFPTEGSAPRKSVMGLLTLQGSLLKALKKKVVYHVNVSLYPGVDVVIPDKPDGSCKDAKFILEWDNPNVVLGFSLIGPSGENIYTEVNESAKGHLEMDIERLGDCLRGESYRITVFALDDLPSSLKFRIKYSWKRDESFEGKVKAFSSASEASILSSILNVPLLYSSEERIPKVTRDTLLKLGVKRVYLVSIGSKIRGSLLNEIKSICKVGVLTDSKEVFRWIMDLTGQNDIVFSTIDPWTYYYVGELKPAGEYKGALFIGPASYLAAHHGVPLIIVDAFPRLSSAIVWHNEFWRRFAAYRLEILPSPAEMILTGRRVLSFLREYGFEREGTENMITVADQFEIGMPWDRTFVGVAYPGRICGSPVDASYWISRDVFYPALIFMNPALSGEVELINGSVSKRSLTGLLRRPFLSTLYIVRESQEERFRYPVLCSLVSYAHRFNERASKYYGTEYQCADGLIPGETNTMNAIDQGSIEMHTGKKGAFFPDMSEDEIVPFYLKRAGYQPLFSTNFSAVTTDLNRGVILWIHLSHGSHLDGGKTLLWNPDHPLVKERNPWRAYEWLLGSTEEPDTMSMDLRGVIPLTNIRLPGLPPVGYDVLLARKPVREFLNRLIPFFDPFRVDNLYDGIVGSLFFSRLHLNFYNGTQFDDALKNLHSLGYITSICQTSNTYLHLTIIRHGSAFQVVDPWPTSWYGGVWRETIPRDLALGCTIGEAFTRGISHVGILHLTDPPQWWWDNYENVVLFGDPALRPFVPSTRFSSANHWEREDAQPLRWDGEKDLFVDGHYLFGATSYPHVRKPLDITLVIAIIAVIAMIVVTCLWIRKKRRSG